MYQTSKQLITHKTRIIYSGLKNNLLPALLVLFYLSEALNKYAIFNFGEPTFVAKAIKGLVLVFCLFSIIFLRKARKKLLLIAALIITFSIGQYFLQPNFDKVVVLNFVKALFPLILFIYYSYNTSNINLTILVFEKIALFNSLFIIIGVLFNVYSFQTYGGSRFGYNGFLVSSATATYFYTIVLFHYFIKYKERLFFNIERLIVLLSLIFIGTKALYLALIVSLFIFLYFYYNKKWKYHLIVILSSIVIFFSYYFVFLHNSFSEIIYKNGIIASITSLRSTILIDQMIPFIKNNWTITNLFFGGINDISTRPQMSLFDLFYFFGLAGSFLYLIIYYKSYFTFKTTKIEKSYFVVIFLACLVSGNFFINATTAIYMVFIRESIISNSFNKN